MNTQKVRYGYSDQPAISKNQEELNLIAQQEGLSKQDQWALKEQMFKAAVLYSRLTRVFQIFPGDKNTNLKRITSIRGSLVGDLHGYLDKLQSRKRSRKQTPIGRQFTEASNNQSRLAWHSMSATGLTAAKRNERESLLAAHRTLAINLATIFEDNILGSTQANTQYQLTQALQMMAYTLRVPEPSMQGIGLDQLQVYTELFFSLNARNCAYTEALDIWTSLTEGLLHLVDSKGQFTRKDFHNPAKH